MILISVELEIQLFLDILAANASCLPTKQTKVFFNEFESFSSNYFPDDCKEFYRIDVVSVASEYRGLEFRIKFLFINILLFRTGLGKLLWLESLKLAHQKGFKFAECGCTAKASTCVGTGVSDFIVKQ